MLQAIEYTLTIARDKGCFLFFSFRYRNSIKRAPHSMRERNKLRPPSYLHEIPCLALAKMFGLDFREASTGSRHEIERYRLFFATTFTAEPRRLVIFSNIPYHSISSTHSSYSWGSVDWLRGWFKWKCSYFYRAST